MPAAAALEAALAPLRGPTAADARDYLLAPASCRERDVARLSRAPCDALVALNLCIDAQDPALSPLNTPSTSADSVAESLPHDSVRSILLYPDCVHNIFERGICVQRTRKKTATLDADDLALQSQDYHVALGRYVRNIETHDITCVVDAGFRLKPRTERTDSTNRASDFVHSENPSAPLQFNSQKQTDSSANVAFTSKSNATTDEIANGKAVPVLRLLCVRSLTDTKRWVYTALFDADALRLGTDDYSALLASEAAMLHRPSCNLCGSDGHCSSLCSAAPEPLKPPHASLKDSVTSHASRSGHMFCGEAVACYRASLDINHIPQVSSGSLYQAVPGCRPKFVTLSRQISIRTERLHNSELANLLRHSAVKLCLAGGICPTGSLPDGPEVPNFVNGPLLPRFSSIAGTEAQGPVGRQPLRKRTRYIEESSVTEEDALTQSQPPALKCKRTAPSLQYREIREVPAGADGDDTDVVKSAMKRLNHFTHEPCNFKQSGDAGGNSLALVRNPVFPVDLKPNTFRQCADDDRSLNDNHSSRLSSLFHQMPSARRLLPSAVPSQPAHSVVRPMLPPLPRSSSLSDDFRNGSALPRLSQVPLDDAYVGDSWQPHGSGRGLGGETSVGDAGAWKVGSFNCKINRMESTDCPIPPLNVDSSASFGLAQGSTWSNPFSSCPNLGFQGTLPNSLNGSAEKNGVVSGASLPPPHNFGGFGTRSSHSQPPFPDSTVSALSGGTGSYVAPQSDMNKSCSTSRTNRRYSLDDRYGNCPGPSLVSTHSFGATNLSMTPDSSYFADPAKTSNLSSSKPESPVGRGTFHSRVHVPPQHFVRAASIGPKSSSDRVASFGHVLRTVPSTVQHLPSVSGSQVQRSVYERQIRTAGSFVAVVDDGGSTKSPSDPAFSSAEVERAEKRLVRKMKNREAAARSNLRRKERDDALKAAVLQGRERLQQLRESEATLMQENTSLKAQLHRRSCIAAAKT